MYFKNFILQVLAFVEKLQSNEKKKQKLLLQQIPKFIIKIFFPTWKKKM